MMENSTKTDHKEHVNHENNNSVDGELEGTDGLRFRQTANSAGNNAEKTEMAGDGREAIMNEISIAKIKERMQGLQATFIGEMEEKLNEVVGEMISEVKSSELLSHIKLFSDEDVNSHKYSNRKKSDKVGSLPEKQFLARNSLLTDLFRIKHIRTIYHIFIAMLIILFLNTVVYDLVDTGMPNFGIHLIIWSFGELRTVIMIWLCMFFATLGVYLCFHLYATHRTKLLPNNIKQWDQGWLCALIVYQCIFLYAPLKSLLYHDLPPASSLIVLMEQIRLIMKSHAFVRSNVSRAKDFKAKSDENDKYLSPCPGFSHFLYFLFVPTLVYRDSYPRTKQVQWRQVAWSLLEVVGVIFYTSFMFERLFIPEFRRFGQHPISGKNLVLSVFGSMMPSMVAMLCSFFCLLHSWQNAFAEMTCFADRMFYQDWWNCSSFSEYYRTWNVIVHDWLYTYIYKDFYEYVVPNNKLIPKLMVFAVSALFHEYILTFTFRYFYPVMFLLFGGFGVGLTFVSRKDDAGNIFMWLALCIGNGLFLSLFSMEWYARINCPPSHDSLLDYAIPRSWTCQPQHS